jgi:hypothetical protein
LARQPDKKYTYAWFISLDYDAWARSLPWIQEQVLANFNAGIITGDQVEKIWEHHEQLVQQKLDAKNKKDPPKVIVKETAPPGGNLGSATAPGADPPLWQKVSEGWGFIFDKTGQALGNAGAGLVGGVSIGNYVVLGGLILIIIKIFKR